jgi:hypothetical protein
MRLPTALIPLVVVAMCCCTRHQDKADEALKQAYQLAADGKFEEALQKHICYHNHALEIDPAHYGVRLSYALSYWIELGKRYPKALEALKAIRDEKAKRLLGGESERTLFHDVAAINHSLGESRATVELFKKLEAGRPDFASSIADMADEALFDAKEYAVERKYVGDPFAKFETAKRVLDDGRQYAKTSRMPERSREAYEIIFTKRIVRLIVVLDKTSDGAVARQIQAKALASCNRTEIKDALQ